MDVIKFPTARYDDSPGPRRSTPGQGQQCLIHVIGRADEYADSIVGGYGQISAGCGPSLGEDFSETIWPVVVKVKPHVTEGDLIQHLRDLAGSLEKHTKSEDMQRTLAEGWQQREGYSNTPIHTEPTEEERRRGVVASGDLASETPF